jgi:disulfide bond formation protein DsbB
VTAGRLSLVVLLISLLVIGGALAFQFVGRLIPCEICLAERWPWYAAIPIAGLFLLWRPRWPLVALVFALVFLGSSGLGFYHVGVEQGFLPGPDACTAPRTAGLTAEELTRQILSAPVVRCDEVQWSLFGVSLAGFNLALSLFVLGLAIWAWRSNLSGARP